MYIAITMLHKSVPFKLIAILIAWSGYNCHSKHVVTYSDGEIIHIPQYSR